MALTTATAVKKLIEGLGLGVPVYNDLAPVGNPPARPYVSIQEAKGGVPGPLEDGGPGAVREHIQIDLWQDWRKLADETVTEDPTLAGRLFHGLHGARPPVPDNVVGAVPGGAGVIYRCIMRGAPIRTVDPSTENLIHHVFDVDVWRQF